MSKKKEEGEDKPKSGKMKLLIGALVLMGLGAGGAYGAVQMGFLGAQTEDAGPDLPRLVGKTEADPFAPPADGADETGAAVLGEGGSEYRTAYYSFEEPFTSNLRDSSGLMQVSIAASTRHDGRVIQWLALHELAIRSAILVELADTPEEDAFTVEGKERLQQRLASAMNRVLEENEGFGGVDKVHFRTFLVQ
jgi:flagellar protein FliL